MNLIYILFMIAFARMAYSAGVVNNEILAGVYTVGTFLMGVLALISTINSRRVATNRAMQEAISNLLIKEKEKKNGTVISD